MYMDGTMIIQINNKKALKLLNDMEDLELIKIVKEQVKTPAAKLSEKYKNTFSKEDAESFNNHVQKMRSEWNNI